jgi:hypothetical protein
VEVDVEDGEVKLFLVLVPHAATTTATATATTDAAFLATPIRPTTGAMSPPPSAPLSRRPSSVTAHSRAVDFDCKVSLPVCSITVQGWRQP